MSRYFDEFIYTLNESQLLQICTVVVIGEQR